MSRPPRTVIEYRNYELPADFPIQMLSGENWRISDVPSGVLHFHNCLEIGLCESDGGFLGFRGEQRAFRAGDVTIISGDVPHTTWSDPGTASKWSYLHLDPFELVRPLFPAEALPNGELLQQAVQGHYYILSPQEYPAVQSLVRSMLAEMQQRQMDYAISVRGLFVALGVELMRITARRESARLCGMSQSHFRRVFRELLSVGPLEHLNRTRILKACSLMRMSEDSILSISGQVGFQSLSSFNRHFLAEMGTTPSQWRSAAGNNPKTSILKYRGWMTPPKD